MLYECGKTDIFVFIRCCFYFVGYWLYVLFVFALYLLPLVTCAPGDIVCGDGSCVDVEHRCDRIFDCVDGTDERDCGKSGDTGNLL